MDNQNQALDSTAVDTSGLTQGRLQGSMLTLQAVQWLLDNTEVTSMQVDQHGVMLEMVEPDHGGHCQYEQPPYAGHLPFEVIFAGGTPQWHATVLAQAREDRRLAVLALAQQRLQEREDWIAQRAQADMQTYLRVKAELEARSVATHEPAPGGPA